MDTSFDAYLRRTLKKSALGKLPPPEGRSRLLRAALQVRLQHNMEGALSGLFFASPFFTSDRITNSIHSLFVTDSIEMRLLINRSAI